jgi:uncharacterized membrane protein YkvA (DUF1232 family)
MNQELQDFITHGAQRITPAHLDKLVRFLPNIRLAVTQVTEFPNLPDQVEFLSEIIEDFHSGLNRTVPFMAIAESAFALFCLRKATDIIPDLIPRMGFADDAAIIRTVFENYKRPFLKHVLARNARNKRSNMIRQPKLRVNRASVEIIKRTRLTKRSACL